jgi:hypothetical protein
MDSLSGRRLIAAGVPIDRMKVGFRILHSLFDGIKKGPARGQARRHRLECLFSGYALASYSLRICWAS